jgi:hypothetical protein
MAPSQGSELHRDEQVAGLALNQIRVPHRDVISNRDWPEVAKDLEGHRGFNAYTLWF